MRGWLWYDGPDMNPEAQLIQRCLKGKTEAWDELFSLHYAAAGRFIFQLSPDLTREDVEEISQEVFLSVVKNLGSFGGKSQLQTWIFRIAVNKTRDYVEKQRAAKRGGGIAPVSLNAEDPETGLTMDPPSTAPVPDAILLQAEDAHLIANALARVPEPCREIIELRYFGDLSYEEIAAELDLNAKTVSSRLSKCMDRLAETARRIFRKHSADPTV